MTTLPLVRTKSDFARLCRGFRIRKGLKQREVAAAIHVAESTYSNLESASFKVIGRARVEAIAELYRLDDGTRHELLDAWERLPLSEYGERRREQWEKRRKLRAKAKESDRLRLALCEMVARVLDEADRKPMCTCQFGGGTVDDPARNCDVCEALQILGIVEGFTSVDRVLDRLGPMQDELEAKLHPKGQTNGNSLPG